MKKIEELIIYTDGGARGNPGPAGIGVVIYDTEKNIIDEISEYIGKTTNNQAEYKAVIAALNKAKELGAATLNFFLDSELVVKQLNREYKVKNSELAPLFLRIYNLSIGFKKIIYKHVRREYNKEADKLVNQAIDNALDN